MRIINDKILPEKLLKVIENDELEWDGGVIITSIDYFEDTIKLELLILLDRSEEKRQLWEVQLKGVRNDNIKRRWAEDITIYDQHYLIEEQKALKSELYVQCKAKNPQKLLYDLYTCFLLKFNQKISFDKYLNKMDLGLLLNMNNGLFAKGPLFILEEINTVLCKNECQTYFLNKTPPKKWANNQWMDQSSDLMVLIIGDSYFVSEEIKFKISQP